MAFETFENEGLIAMGGAGVQAAQFIAQKGAKALVTGNIRPNAAFSLSSSGVNGIYGFRRDCERSCGEI